MQQCDAKCALRCSEQDDACDGLEMGHPDVQDVLAETDKRHFPFLVMVISFERVTVQLKPQTKTVILRIFSQKTLLLLHKLYQNFRIRP